MVYMLWLLYCMKKRSIVSAHRQLLGLALVVCLKQNMCVPYVTLEARSRQTNYAIQISTSIHPILDSKTVPGCHYNSCSKSQFCSD